MPKFTLVSEHLNSNQFGFTLPLEMLLKVALVLCFLANSILGHCLQATSTIVCPSFQELAQIPDKSSVKTLTVDNYNDSYNCGDSKIQSFVDLKEINIVNGQFDEKLTDCLDQVKGLIKVNLNNNSITDLNVVNISGDLITDFYINNNNLTVLNGSHFKEWSKLKNCELSYNPIRIIDFSNCNITSYESYDLLINLEKSNSNITTRFTLGTFAEEVETKLIEEIILSNNQIKIIRHLSLYQQPIRRLVLDHNLIEEINSHVFYLFPNLIELNLSNNLIANIQSGAFDGLGKMQTLNLNNNCLRVVSDQMFLSLHRLRRIDLSKNMLPYFRVVGWNYRTNSLTTTLYQVSHLNC